MKRNICCCALFIFQLHFINLANAGDENGSVQTCLEMRGKESGESELDCYRQAAEKLGAERKRTLIPTRAHGLAREWEPNNDALNAYKQNYALVYARSSLPNNAPTSPNPQNQVPFSYALDNRDLKFQISLKHDLADFHQYGSLWFGYTQLSFWQFYDASNSRPFRESNYEPEFIYSFRRTDNWMPGSDLLPSILNFGVVHQSNGQSTPRSRSWNRVYIQPGLESNFGDNKRLEVLLRWWQRIEETPVTDDNPDITKYLGHGDIEVRYSHDSRWEISAIGRARSIQLDLSLPWASWLSLSSFRIHNTNVHFQYFSGYGESLIDYNQKHHTWGGGLSFPFY